MTGNLSYWVRLIGANLTTGAVSWGFNFDLIPTLLLGIGVSLYVIAHDMERLQQ